MEPIYIYFFFSITTILWFALTIFAFRLSLSLKKMSDSFNKLGYIAREDTKKYFDESAQRAVEVFEGAANENKKNIEVAMSQSLQESASIVKTTIVEAEKDATKIITQARAEAINIGRVSQEEADQKFDQLVTNAVQAVDWAMEQMIKEKYSQREHEEIIKKLIGIYVDEHAKS